MYHMYTSGIGFCFIRGLGEIVKALECKFKKAPERVFVKSNRKSAHTANGFSLLYKRV